MVFQICYVKRNTVQILYLEPIIVLEASLMTWLFLSGILDRITVGGVVLNTKIIYLLEIPPRRLTEVVLLLERFVSVKLVQILVVKQLLVLRFLQKTMHSLTNPLQTVA